MSKPMTFGQTLHRAFEELKVLCDRFGDSTHPLGLANGQEAWELLLNCSDDSELLSLIQTDNFVHEAFLSHWRQPVQMTKELQRSLVIGAIRGDVIRHNNDPRMVTSQAAFHILEKLAELHPTMVSASWYRSANGEEREAFSREWEAWRKDSLR